MYYKNCSLAVGKLLVNQTEHEIRNFLFNEGLQFQIDKQQEFASTIMRITVSHENEKKVTEAIESLNRWSKQNEQRQR